MQHVYVIGGGITGMITGYLKNATVITDSTTFPCWMPVFLWSTNATKKFVQQLFGDKCDVRTAKARIAFTYNGYLIANDVGRELYSIKVYNTVKQKAACKGRDEFEYIDIPVQVIYEKLKCKVRQIRDKVVRIDTDQCKITLASGRELEYTELYSTVPLPVFEKLVACKVTTEEYKWLNMYYALNIDCNTKFDYDIRILYVSDRSPVTRIFNMGNYFVMESLNRLEFGPVMKVINRIGMQEFDSIKLIGRNAMWDPNIMLHHVIEGVM